MKNYFITLLGLLTLHSCKVDEEFDGPSLNDLYGEFAIIETLDVSAETVDFSAGETVHCTAVFSKNVDWKVTIVGMESGAEKEISGFSNMLDATNSTWDGGTTQLPFFRTETCAVELTFEAEPDTLRDTIMVTGTKLYDAYVLADFESGMNPGWNIFAQSGAQMSFGVVESVSSAQGDNYFDMGGIVNWDWLIGLIDLPGSAYGDVHFDLDENPNMEYFNVMLLKDQALNNGIVLFQFREDDNNDGVYSQGVEDMFSLEITLTENGWNLYSSKYADLQTLINGQPSADIGNGIREPHRLIQISMLFLANPSSGYAHSAMDYISFTKGGPLVP